MFCNWVFYDFNWKIQRKSLGLTKYKLTKNQTTIKNCYVFYFYFCYYWCSLIISLKFSYHQVTFFLTLFNQFTPLTFSTIICFILLELNSLYKNERRFEIDIVLLYINKPLFRGDEILNLTSMEINGSNSMKLR